MKAAFELLHPEGVFMATNDSDLLPTDAKSNSLKIFASNPTDWQDPVPLNKTLDPIL